MSAGRLTNDLRGAILIFYREDTYVIPAYLAGLFAGRQCFLLIVAGARDCFDGDRLLGQQGEERVW